MLAPYCIAFSGGVLQWPTIVQSGFSAALGGASTSRVLNLFRIAADNADNPEHLEKPLFVSPIINKTFLLKHRTRADESYLFASPRAVATKIIIPFDSNDLRAGGRSLFVDQRGYAETLREAGNYQADSLERDLSVLRLLNSVPSLDPFLLREHLRNHKIEVSPSYFAISEGDQERMHRFVTQEMTQLIALAGGDGASSGRLVSAHAVQPDRREAGAAAPDPGPDRQRLPRRRVQLARLSLLQMVDGQVLARRDGRAARDQHHPARSAARRRNRRSI